MSKTGRTNHRRHDRELRRQAKRERRINVRSERRTQPDMRMLGKAFLALALADATREAAEQNRETNQEDTHGSK